MSDQEQDDSQKTEDPTQKKLDDAREKGQVPISREVNHLFVISGALIIIAFSAHFINPLVLNLRSFLEFSHYLTLDSTSIQMAGLSAVKTCILFLALPLFVLFIVALIGPILQTGFMITADHVIPKMERVSPIKGIGRQFSLKAIIEFIKGLLKISCVVGVVLYVMWPIRDHLTEWISWDMMDLLEETRSLSLRLIMGVLSVVLVITILDVFYQRYQFNQQMRMSKQELKDEYKQSEGDPQIKGRIRQIRNERARQRMMAAVPTADVVITNPTHYAVALSYNPDKMNAPILVAKGVDNIALKIREVAKEHNVMIMENPPLARALYASVEIDHPIPEDHYKAVAEIISYVFKLKRKALPR